MNRRADQKVGERHGGYEDAHDDVLKRCFHTPNLPHYSRPGND